jgi:hypothetical protein
MISELSEFANINGLSGFVLHVLPEDSGRVSVIVETKLGTLTKEQENDSAIMTLRAALSTPAKITGTAEEIDETLGKKLIDYTNNQVNLASMYNDNLETVNRIAIEAQNKAAELAASRKKPKAKPAAKVTATPDKPESTQQSMSL